MSEDGNLVASWFVNLDDLDEYIRHAEQEARRIVLDEHLDGKLHWMISDRRTLPDGSIRAMILFYI